MPLTGVEVLTGIGALLGAAGAGILGAKKLPRLKNSSFLTKDKHTDLCKIASLEMQGFVCDTVKESTRQILEAIEKSHG